MVSALEASKKFARLQQDQETLLWQYVTETAPRQKQLIGLKIIGLKLKQSLMGAFYGAVLDVDNADDDNWNAADRRRLRDAILHARALSPAGAVQRALLMRACMEKWGEAKQKNDFSVVSDSLQGLVDSIRKEAQYKAQQMGISSPYEALIRSKTPGFSMAEFEKLAVAVAGFSRQALNVLPKGEQPSAPWAMAKKDQQWVQDGFLRRIGYDFNRGQIKEAPHPLCFGTHDRVGIGMRYDESDFGEVMLSAAHEGGHAVYRQSLPAQYRDRLVGGIAGTGMDEAMALIIENHVGRNGRILNYIADHIRVNMPEHDDPALTGENLFKHLNRISERPIRTGADEVRYPLDIILRYTIEKALIDGNLQTKDIPAVWAEQYEKLTGMKVKDANEGPLQDIHWFGGEFGWFPNYLIGQLAAAQLFEAAQKDQPEILKKLQKGDISRLMGWLHENVYSHGARYTTFELVDKATGKPLDQTAWFKHIIGRYLKPLVVRETRPALPAPGQS